MTVAELILELQKYPPHAVVLKESFLGTFYLNVGQPCTETQLVEPSRKPGANCVYEKASKFSSSSIRAVVVK